MLRIKITDEMVEACIDRIRFENALDGGNLPSESESPEIWARAREVMRACLQDAAATLIDTRKDR